MVKMSPASRFRYALFGLTALALLVLCGLGGMFGHIGEHAFRFILLFSATWIVALALLVLIPRDLSRSRRGLLVFALALACRLLLLPHPPSDDVNRYLWEGRVVREAMNPYVYEPTSPALQDPAKDDPYHAGINHPHLPAAYPPLMLLLFSAAAGFAYHPMTVKLVMLLFDMGTLDDNRVVLVGGQDGWVGSDRFLDMLPLNLVDTFPHMLACRRRHDRAHAQE